MVIDIHQSGFTRKNKHLLFMHELISESQDTYNQESKEGFLSHISS